MPVTIDTGFHFFKAPAATQQFIEYTQPAPLPIESQPVSDIQNLNAADEQDLNSLLPVTAVQKPVRAVTSPVSKLNL